MSAQELQDIISPKFTEQVLFDMIIKKSGLSDIKMKKIEIGAASKKGDSYLSNVLRFTLEATGKNSEGKEEEVSLPVIVKYLPKNVARRKTYRSADFFENEIIFYEKVWSVFQQFLESKNIKEKFDNIPLVLSAFYDGSNDYIAMQDVSYEGYRSAERDAGLNYEHTVAILRLFGRFHALSFALKDQQPEVFEKAATSLKETYFSEKFRGWYIRFQEQLIAIARHAVEKELPAVYLEKFEKLVKNDLFGTACKLSEVRGPLSVVTHGDVWAPNFLIKYDSKQKIQDIIMIDFQLTRYTTLASDITFFLYSCADPNLWETRWDDLIGQYYEALSEAIEVYGSNKNLVSLEDIHEEIKKYNTFGLVMALEAVPMALLDDDEISDLDAIQGTEAVPIETVWSVHPFEDPEKRRRVANVIKFSVDKNFL